MRIDSVLNIGRLGGDLDAVVAYYAADIDETKTSATAEYYFGNESGGRWVGSLQGELAVDGAVGSAEFRRLLEGLYPHSGEPLTLGSKSSLSRSNANQQVPNSGMLSVTQAAKHLNIGPRHVRKLLERGASTGEIGDASYLKGEQRKPGRGRWKVPAVEVNRILNERNKQSARPGFDLTLRPPKSVSILWALGTPEITKAVADAHRQSVDEVVHYYEQCAVFSRKRVQGDQMRISTRGLIGAAFDHRTSRAGDPLLHTHVVVFNATLCSDGEWRSIEAPILYEHAKTGGYLYQVQLRHLLAKALGVSWTPTVNGVAEIEGVSPMLIDHFSKRRDEIETAAAITGHSSAGAFQVATLHTRKTKTAGAEPLAEISRWRKEAQDLGFDLSRLISTAKTQAVEDRVEVGVETFVEMSGPNGLTKMTSTFAERDVIRELAQRAGPSLGARQVCDLASAFVTSTNPIRLQGKGRDDDRKLLGDSIVREPSVTRYTTAELFGKEADLLSWASAALKGGGAKANVEALSRYKNLSDEQQRMVRSVVKSGRRLHLISGHPGSGKTYAMQVAVEAFSLAGVRVVGAAVSAQAADELESSVNFREFQGREATTISALLADLSSPQFWRVR